MSGIYHMQQGVANMNVQDYQNTITTNASPQEAIEEISHVSDWWAVDFSGASEKRNDVFTVRFKSGDSYVCKVVEIIPEKKIVWRVIDAYQGWHPNHSEWVGTSIIWEISVEKDGTQVKMTHEGLVPEFECFDACNQGWNYLIQKSLQKLLDENNGMPV